MIVKLYLMLEILQNIDTYTGKTNKTTNKNNPQKADIKMDQTNIFEILLKFFTYL